MTEQISTSTPTHWARRFFPIWTAQALSLLGSQLVQFALIWWLTQTTGSAIVLTTASLAGLLPQVLLGPLLGTLVDRWNRRIIMIIADAVSALSIVVLAVLFALGMAEYWHIYMLMFVRSVAGGFHWPAMQASTSLMVPKEHLARIQGLNQMLWGGLSIVSAPLGALLLAWLPMQGILAIDVVTAAIAITPLFFIAIPQPERIINGQAAKTSVWQEFKEGLAYVWGWPGLLLICAMATVINFLLNPAFSLMPILVTKHFNGQAIQLATMESFWGIGMILGGLALSAWGGFKRRITTTLVGLLGMGAGCLAMGLLPSSAFTLAVATMFWLGFVNPIVNGPLMAAVQAAVAPEMQGRVFTIIQSVAAGMSPLGLIIAGPVAEYLGAQSWFVIGGVVTVLMGIVGLFIPAIMHFEDGRAGQPTAEPEAEPLKTDLQYT